MAQKLLCAEVPSAIKKSAPLSWSRNIAILTLMKTYIKNRDNNKISVVVEGPESPGKLAFVMHGLGGSKEQPHIRAMAEAFLDKGYTVITFDTVHTFGESEGGLYEDATVTNYYSDLEDVVAWASEQPWHTEPFVLCGHSLGGMSTTLFAEKYPERVSALAPLSTVVSGKLSMETKGSSIDTWKRDGIKESMSSDGKRLKRLKWSHMEDRLKYDLLVDVDKLTMPVLLIVGENDDTTPLEHQEILYNKLPGKKELHVIKKSAHTFRTPKECVEIKNVMKTWLNNL